jgi:hypothetical protein
MSIVISSLFGRCEDAVLPWIDPCVETTTREKINKNNSNLAADRSSLEL